MEYFTQKLFESEISRIGFGCAAMSGYDYGPINEREIIKSIRFSWEKGVTLFDTSDVYGFGYAEEVLSKALGSERHKAIITTKFGIKWDKNGNTYKDCSIPNMLESLDNSLRRLKLEFIPIYMIHWHDGKTSINELIFKLKECQKQGKIKYIGCSNFTEEMVLTVLENYKLDFIQLPHNLIYKKNEDQLLNCKKNKNIYTIVYDVLARGLLTGKYKKNVNFVKNDTRKRDKYFNKHYNKMGLNIVNKLEKLSKIYNKTPGQIAIKWSLQQSFINYVLVGCKNLSQTAENIDMFDWEISEEDQLILSN